MIVAAGRLRGNSNFAIKLVQWSQSLPRRRSGTPTVGSFLERKGFYFLKRSAGDKSVFSFNGPAVTVTHGHIMGHKPPVDAYTTNPADDGPFSEAEELSWRDFALLITTQDDFGNPPTIRRIRRSLGSGRVHPAADVVNYLGP